MPFLNVECGSASGLNFTSGEFDLVLQSMMFTSILDRDMKAMIAHEMLRVVKSTDSIVWYDFHVNNPLNKDVRAIKAKAIKLLFPSCRIEFTTLILTLAIARPVARISTGLHSALSAVFVLKSHSLVFIQPL